MIYQIKSINLERAISIVWALVLFTLPFPYIPFNSQLMLLLLVISFLYFQKTKRGNFISIRPHLYFVLPFLVSLMSWVFLSKESIKVLEKEAAFMIFPIITFLLLRVNFRFSKKDYNILLYVFLSSILIILFFSYIRSLFLPEDFLAHEFLTFDIIHPTYFSFYCGLSIFIILHLVKDQPLRVKWLAYFLILLILSYMTYLSSRMPLISTLGLLLIKIITETKSKMRWASLVIVGIIIMILSFIIYQSPRLEYRFLLAFNKNLEMRMVGWQASLDIYKQHSILGVGAGSEQRYLDKYYEDNITNSEDHLGLNSHNYILHILVVYGTVGFLVILVFWIYVGETVIKSGNNLFIYTILLFALCSMTEVMLARQKGIVFFCLFFSMNVLSSLNTTTKSCSGAEDNLKMSAW
jgi:O-antigen ligase